MVSIAGPCCGERPYNSSPNMDVWCAHMPQWLDQQAVWWRNDSRPGTISLHALQRAAPSLARLLVLDLELRFFAEVHPICWHRGANSVARLRCRDARGIWCKTHHFSGRTQRWAWDARIVAVVANSWGLSRIEYCRGFCGVATRPWLQCVRFGAVVVHTGLLWSWECLHDFVKDWRRYRAWNCWELSASFILKSWDVRKLIWSLQLDVFLQVIDFPFSWYAVPTRNCSKNHPKVIGVQHFRFMNKWGPKHDGNPVRCGFFASAQWWRILLCSLTLQQILRRFLIDHETYIYILYISTVYSWHPVATWQQSIGELWEGRDDMISEGNRLGNQRFFEHLVTTFLASAERSFIENGKHFWVAFCLKPQDFKGQALDFAVTHTGNKLRPTAPSSTEQIPEVRQQDSPETTWHIFFRFYVLSPGLPIHRALTLCFQTCRHLEVPMDRWWLPQMNSWTAGYPLEGLKMGLPPSYGNVNRGNWWSIRINHHSFFG